MISAMYGEAAVCIDSNHRKSVKARNPGAMSTRIADLLRSLFHIFRGDVTGDADHDEPFRLVGFN